MAVEIEQQVLFDVQAKIAQTHELLNEYQGLLKRTIELAMKIGRNLCELRNNISHGQFLGLLQSEFGLSQRTAYNFMSLVQAEEKLKLAIIANLPLYILYELAPAPAVVIDMVTSKQIPATIPAIREAKREIQKETIETPQNTQPFAVLRQALVESGVDPDEVDWEEDVEEETEEDRYMTAVDNGTLDYYYDDLRRDAIQRDREPTKSATLIALQSSESNEWFTPDQYVSAARDLMGGIDIDPASNAFANEIIQATTYYDINTNGLDKPWHGRVWLNPPYGRDITGSNQDVWSKRLLEQYKAGITTEAVLLVNANTEAKWFQPFYDYLICLTNHRIRFYTNDGTSSQPTQGNALIYLGTQQERFIQIFKQFGRVIKAVD